MSWSWLDCKCIQLMQTLVCGQRNINIFSEQTADFLFFLPLFVIGHLATFSPAVVQNLSLRSGCCDVPRATAANVRSVYNLPVSLYPSIPLLPGESGWMAEHTCQSLWKWLKLTSYMRGTLPWPGGQGTLSGRQSGDGGRAVDAGRYMFLINRGSKDSSLTTLFSFSRNIWLRNIKLHFPRSHNWKFLIYFPVFKESVKHEASGEYHLNSSSSIICI